MTPSVVIIAGTYAVAGLVLLAVGAWRGIRIGRSAVGSHRHSVRLGVRMGRWQTVLVLIMAAALIGAR